jgi:uncharacterized membrane protein
MRRLKQVMKWLLGIFFVLAGANHFVHADFYVKIMPPYLPWHRELVALSGVAEVVLGVLVLIPQTTVPAAWGLIALLCAVFPANVHMALNNELFPEYPPVVLWARLPLQGILIAWAWWFARNREPQADTRVD